MKFDDWSTSDPNYTNKDYGHGYEYIPEIQDTTQIAGTDYYNFTTLGISTAFIIIEFNRDRTKFKVVGVYAHGQLISDEYKDFTKYQILPVNRNHYMWNKYQITWDQNIQSTLTNIEINCKPEKDEDEWIDITAFINNDDFDITVIYNTETSIFESQYDKNVTIPKRYQNKKYKLIKTSFLDSYAIELDDCHFVSGSTSDTSDNDNIIEYGHNATWDTITITSK